MHRYRVMDQYRGDQRHQEAFRKINVENDRWGRGMITSTKAVVDALATRNARRPGTKLTRMAASGVCPLFVLPIVLRILLKPLFRARKNRIRLDT